MATFDSLKAKIQGLIDKANAKTGKVDKDLTSGVNSLVDGYLIPSGDVNITSNGTHNVSGKANAVVSVPVPEGYIKPSGTKEITANNTYNVTEYESVEVNVPDTPAVLQDKTVTPTTSEQTVKSDSGFDGLNEVTVKAIQTETKSITPTKSAQSVTPTSGKYLTKVDVGAIPSDYVIPSGDANITSNGTHNVSGKAQAVVNVPIPDGYVKPTGEIEVTENGTYDVTEKASVSVNVASTGGGEGYQMSLSDDGTELNFVWGGAKKEITFTIAGTSYTAEEGMTWAEWVESTYNTEEWDITVDDIRRHELPYVYIVNGVYPNDVIQENNYTTTSYVVGGGGN